MASQESWAAYERQAKGTNVGAGFLDRAKITAHSAARRERSLDHNINYAIGAFTVNTYEARGVGDEGGDG